MKYCPYWRTVKKEYKKCFYDWVSSQENGMVWSEICCNKDNRYVYTCCDQSCSAEYYNARFPQVEKEDCFCLEAAANGNYCRRWNCTNIDVYNEYLLTEVPNSHPDQKYYECTAESPDGQYCANWEGQSESVEEFEVSKCFCKTHGTYCFTWDCLEKGVDFWWPNLLWILLSSLLGGLGQVPALLLVGSMAKTGFLLAIYIYYACMLIWGGGFIVIGVWKCGILALIVTGTQIFILPLYFFYVLWRRVHRDDNNNSTQKRRHRSGRGYLSMSRNCLAGCLESLARGLRQEPSVQYFPEPQTVPPAAVAVPGEAVNEVELGGMVFDADDPALAVKAGDGYAPVAMAL